MTLSGYGIGLTMAFTIAWVVIARLTAGQARNYSIANQIVLVSAVGGLLGSKTYFALFAHGGSLLTRGGYSFWGGLIGGAFACVLFFRARGLNCWPHADATAIAIAAGYSVARTGCWAIGDDYGIPWRSPLAVRFPEGAPPSTAANMLHFFGEHAPAGVSPNTVLAVHPTQLYEVLLGFLLFLILWRFRDHTREQGWLLGLYAALAGIERFFIDFLRVKADRLAIGLSLSQVVALGVLTVGVALIYVRRHDRMAHS